MSLRNERRRTNSTDPFLRALLGLALVRGPDVHVLHAEGALLRPVNRHTNAEIEGVRLLTAVAAETGWPEVVTELAAVAVATGKSESLATTAEALDRVPAAMRDASYWMALAEVELAREDAPAARAAAEHVTDEEPRAQRALGIARMLSESDPAPGADIYLKGLARAARVRIPDSLRGRQPGHGIDRATGHGDRIHADRGAAGRRGRRYRGSAEAAAGRRRPHHAVRHQRYDSQQGQVLATSRDIPSFSGSALGLSDIVIARRRMDPRCVTPRARSGSCVPGGVAVPANLVIIEST